MEKMRKDVLRDLALHVLCAGALHLGPDRPAHGAACSSSSTTSTTRAPCASPPACSTTSSPTPRHASAAAHGQGPPPEDLLYDADRRQAAELRHVLQQHASCSTFPTSAIWKTRSAPCSVWRARPSASSSGRRESRNDATGTARGSSPFSAYLLGGRQRGDHRIQIRLSPRRARLRAAATPASQISTARYGATGIAGVIGIDVLKGCASAAHRRAGAHSGARQARRPNPCRGQAVCDLLSHPRPRLPGVLRLSGRQGHALRRDHASSIVELTDAGVIALADFRRASSARRAMCRSAACCGTLSVPDRRCWPRACRGLCRHS